MSDAGVAWLSPEQQFAWRGWISSHALLAEALERDLKKTHGLTMADYEILVRLSEAPQRRMRMSELADVTFASRSRLSHQIARMEQKGWVLRLGCPTDRRGTLAELSENGWQLLVDAAPSHVASVRRHLVDALTPAEFEAAGAAGHKIARHLLDAPEATHEPPIGVPAAPS